MTGETIRLMKRKKVAEGTMAFTFDRSPEFEFRAGQAIDVTLLEPPETDSEGNVRTFTLASAPFEDTLMIATRMRDTAFKRVLRDAPLGLEVKVDKPTGSFNLHKNAARPAVFLAGGIGVTPFLSILRQAVKDGVRRRIDLFYSNRRPEDTAFLDELDAAARSSEGTRGAEDDPAFHFVPTMTRMDTSSHPWTGETGPIDRAMLLRHIPALQGPIYYVAGPPTMVAAMRQMLVSAGVDEDDIRTEEFAGY